MPPVSVVTAREGGGALQRLQNKAISAWKAGRSAQPSVGLQERVLPRFRGAALPRDLDLSGPSFGCPRMVSTHREAPLEPTAWSGPHGLYEKIHLF